METVPSVGEERYLLTKLGQYGENGLEEGSRCGVVQVNTGIFERRSKKPPRISLVGIGR